MVTKVKGFCNILVHTSFRRVYHVTRSDLYMYLQTPKVNFYAEFNSFELRDFLLRWFPSQS